MSANVGPAAGREPGPGVFLQDISVPATGLAHDLLPM
jgi:hypothetical protein